MKKIFSLMLLLVTLATFAACNKDDDKEEPEQSLAGTTWASRYYYDTMWIIIRFENAARVIGSYSEIIPYYIPEPDCYGSYWENGDSICLDFAFHSPFQSFHFTDGYISGDSLMLNYWEKEDDNLIEFTKIFHQIHPQRRPQ